MEATDQRVGGAELKRRKKRKEKKKDPKVSATVSVITGWVADRYVLGLELAPRFLPGHILCRLYKSPFDVCMHTTAVPIYVRMPKDRIRTFKILWSKSGFSEL